VTEVQGRTFLRPSKSPSQRSVGNDKQHGIFKAKSIAEGLAIVDEQTKAAYAGKRPDVAKSAIAGSGRERQPTSEEKYLLAYLHLPNVEALEKVLNAPSWGCLDMHPPDTSASERWDRFLEDEWEREQAKKKKSEEL
jgi:hypothetical protein